MKIVLRLAPFVFLQLMVVGANLSTLERYNDFLGGGAADLALLWLAYMVPRAILTPAWAALSDRIGRRPVILIGGVGQVAASILYALGGGWGMLFASRLLDSLTSAHGAIAHSIVADSTPPEKRSAGLGMLGALVSLAFIAGPILGALTAQHLGFAALGWGFAAAQIASLAYYALAIPETAPKWKPRAISNAAKAWTPRLPGRSVRILLAISVLASAGTFSFYSAMPLATVQWFGWGALEAGKAFAVLGFVGALAQGGLVRPLASRFGEKPLIIAGLAIAATGLAVGTLASIAAVWTATVLVALGGGLLTPSLGGLLSRSVDSSRQGLAMGLYQSTQTLGRGVGPALAALAALAGPASAFGVGALVCLAAAAGLHLAKLDKQNEAAGPRAASEGP